jgi:hypothetical protein
MGIVSRSADTFYTYRFIKILTTPWDEMDAYDLGIIDENGDVLKKARQLRTSEEKDAYTLFHRLVFNIKRLLEKLPLGRRRIASYAAALFLLREEAGMSEEQIAWVLEQMDIDIDGELIDPVLSEGATEWFVHPSDGYSISPGVYTLTNDAVSPSTGERVAPKGSKVCVDEGTRPCGNVFGIRIYQVTHAPTHVPVYVCEQDICR